jgi:hypothetical protein
MYGFHPMDATCIWLNTVRSQRVRDHLRKPHLLTNRDLKATPRFHGMGRTKHTSRPSVTTTPAMPVRIEVRWRVLMAASGTILWCALYTHPDGIEVRCGFSGETLIRSQVDRSLKDARRRAASWLVRVKRIESCEGPRVSAHQR